METALVTGASRGVGAAVAQLLAARGLAVILNYRNKTKRALQVQEEITGQGGSARLLPADLTDPGQRATMLQELESALPGVMVLCASGGLEKEESAGYPWAINVEAQLALLEWALFKMPPGGRVVYVTSHLAHFGESDMVPSYTPVAESKRACEVLLRQSMPRLTDRGLSLAVVSGAMVEGTVTPRLLEKKHPGYLQQRAQQGAVITALAFAEVVVEAALNRSLPTGTTLLAGNVYRKT